MKLKVAVIILALSLLAVPLFSCSSNSNAASASANQTVTVQRGNISVDVTGAGNLALSQVEDLAFEVAGTVDQVEVDVGDSVVKGQELARVDTTDWDKKLKTLEKAVVTAQRNLTTKTSALTSAKRLVTTKESALTTAKRQVTTKEFAVRQAEADVQTAENNLSQIGDVKKAQDDIDNAEYAVKFGKDMMTGGLGLGAQIDYGYWKQWVTNAQDQLTVAKENLQDILKGTSITVDDDVMLQVTAKQLLVEKSQMALEDAQTAVETARTAVNDAQLAIDDAKTAVINAQLDVDDAVQAVADAQSDLDDARSKSPVIKAPFDGFITKVNVAGGDEVLKGTVAVTLADPNKFKADILVSEMDIPQVRIGSNASLTVSALPGIILSANVTQISPTATISSGVVNYKVKVEVQSQAAAQPQRLSGQQLPSDNTTAGSSDNTTSQPAQNTTRQRPTVGQFPSSGQSTATVPRSFQLKDGLTVTVVIVLAQRSNVVRVPNAAITTRGGQSSVQVVSATGVSETRIVQTGISDWQYTEITSGLNEGEKIVVPQSTATAPTSTATSQPRPGAIPFFGGR